MESLPPDLPLHAATLLLLGAWLLMRHTGAFDLESRWFSLRWRRR